MINNKVIKHYVSIIISILFLISCNQKFYASEKLSVNDSSVSKGDIVTYSFYMSDVDKPIEALGAFIYYDSDFLEYVDDSIGFDVLKNAMTNITDGQIYYSAIDVVDGFNFKEEGLVVTASFKVLDTASGSELIINHFDEIFTFENEDVDLTPKDYHSRQEITVNGEISNKNLHDGINAANVYESPDADLVTGSFSSSEPNSDSNSYKPLFYTVGAVVLIIVNAFGAAVIIKRKK